MALDNVHTVAVLVVLGVLGLAIYRFVLWVIEAPRTVDPWGNEIEEEVNREEAVPLCHHCLAPQEHSGWFCPECGATVGPYCNYMPYIYVFSQGEVVRAGVTERMRRSPLITTGLVLLPLCMFALAAPIYWFFLFKNLGRSDPPPPEAPPVIS
jgi:hypothetical protein